MPAIEPVDDEQSSHVRGYVCHPWLSFVRPSVLALAGLLITLGFAREWPPTTQFLLLRCIDLLVITMYFWQFARHSPSFLEASGILLISLGFLYLVAKAALMASALILSLVLAWLVMTWIAKRWPLLRGLTTLALLIALLQSALRIMRDGDFVWVIHEILSLLFLCLLTFLAFVSSRTWHEAKMFIPKDRVQSLRLWSSFLVLVVFAQTLTSNVVHTSSGLHQSFGCLVAGITVLVAWKVRFLFDAANGLRLVPPALMVMPLNQIILGHYALHPENGSWLAQLHHFNGLCILMLSCLITISVWSRTLGIGLPAR